ILLSQPFKFIIGHRKKLFTIHENAVYRLSKSLNDLLNGSMKEANEHCVYWEDVDEKTFLRFAQWAYTGEYSPAEPDLIIASAQLASFKLGSTLKASVDNTAHSLASFSIAFNNHTGFSSPTILHTPRKNKESCEEYSEIFLSHARLYTLADKYDIPELRKLSLHKIYVSLKEFTLYPNRVGDVVNLASYSFENTITGDRLRTLLVDYCACILEDILENEGFKDLVDKSPDFAFELIKKLRNRLD
ncbi:hypothetical protein MKX08_007229, partial [Trichoderma sp. CBMAI-0020]